MKLTARPATQSGALAGFSYDCPQCGMEVTSSMESIARRDAWAHIDWHATTGR
jgi:hypothetical protein